jgi:hypothetical protein
MTRSLRNDIIYRGDIVSVTTLLDKGKAVPVLLTDYHAVKAYWGSGVTAPRILDFRTRERRVVSFTARPLYPQGNSP